MKEPKSTILRWYVHMGDSLKNESELYLLKSWFFESYPLYSKYEELWMQGEFGPYTFMKYFPLLELVNQPGKVLEIGCGCGMVLKFLQACSQHQLELFGLDGNPDKIDIAKRIVFPNNKENFKTGSFQDKTDFSFKTKFDAIVSILEIVGYNNENVEFLMSQLNSGGVLIFVAYRDLPESIGVEEMKKIFQKLESNGFSKLMGGYNEDYTIEIPGYSKKVYFYFKKK
ncbi:MAG: class I SAM-dependent methyltransferase [Candidatus Altiarchaeota archaeon]|nr:class I SAM-dependent methyltransferase [Candidatus Altiarchaeota archaeon]